MTTSRRTLMNSFRAYLYNNERYCREVTVSFTAQGDVEIGFSKGRPCGMWDSPERKFNADLDNIADQCGYVIREVDDLRSVVTEKR